MHKKGLGCPTISGDSRVSKNRNNIQTRLRQGERLDIFTNTQVLVEPDLTLNRNNTQGIERCNSIKICHESLRYLKY
jgi:hypothetical protein